MNSNEGLFGSRDADQSMTSIDVLEIGAGMNPHPDATHTLDIRDDLDHIDFPGVDIGSDEWPLADESVERMVGYHVLEHIPPTKVGHVFREIDRVLVPGGTVHFELPHAGTYSARTDLTHYGTGGSTPGVARYFSGGLEDYWPELEWDVRAWADVEGPLFVRPALRFTRRVRDPMLANELVKIPFVTGMVTIRATKTR